MENMAPFDFKAFIRSGTFLPLGSGASTMLETLMFPIRLFTFQVIMEILQIYPNGGQEKFRRDTATSCQKLKANNCLDLLRKPIFHYVNFPLFIHCASSGQHLFKFPIACTSPYIFIGFNRRTKCFVDLAL